jgi:hypothetical protein
MSDRVAGRHARRGGLLLKLLLLLAVLGALCAITWVVVLPSLVVSTLKAKTGFSVRMDELSVNPFTATVHVGGLVVRNPDGWPEPGFVELRRFEADGRVLSLFTDRLEADRVVLDVAQVTLVRNHDGTLNAAVFKDGLAGAAGTGGAGSSPGGGRRGFFIKHLVLKFDRLVYADYSGRQPAVKSYEVALKRDLTDVDSLTKIISPFTGTALGLVSGTLGNLFHGRDDLLKSAPAAVKDTVGTLQDAGRRTGEGLKNLIQSLEKKKP